jgi:RNA polymerase sigma-70 factor (ECF subfamily)
MRGIAMLGFYLMMLDTPEEQSRMAQIWKKYHKYFLNIAKKYLADRQTAEDAVSDTFTKIIENKEKLFKMSENDFQAYTTVICKNCCLIILRNNKKCGSLEKIPEGEIVEEDLADILENRENIAILMECLRDLDLENKTILQWHYVNELTLKESAEKTGISLSAVKNSLARARGKLKKLLIERQAVC